MQRIRKTRCKHKAMQVHHNTTDVFSEETFFSLFFCFQSTLKSAHVWTRLLLTQILSHSAIKVLFPSLVLENEMNSVACLCQQQVSSGNTSVVLRSICIAFFWCFMLWSLRCLFLMCFVLWSFSKCCACVVKLMKKHLVFCLFACVFLSCCAVSSQGHRSI